MRKIILGLILLMATGVVASDNIYKIGQYEVKNNIVYIAGTNTKLNGITKMYYESGVLQGEFNIKDGKENGITKWYYPSGALKTEVNMKDGKVNGTTKWYYQTGILQQEVNIQNGKAISGVLYKENGKKLRDATNTDFAKLGLE